MTRAAPIIALYDANVLYPASLRDFLIRVARSGLVGARWSEPIHEEWIRNLLKNRPDLTREQLERTRRLMDAAAPGALVDRFEAHVAVATLPDPGDLHVLAAAIEAKAEVIVTMNVRDFPQAVVGQFGIRVRSPDAFILELLDREPNEMYAVLRAHRSALRKPPLSVEQYLDQLARAGLRRSVQRLRETGIAL